MIRNITMLSEPYRPGDCTTFKGFNQQPSRGWQIIMKHWELGLLKHSISVSQNGPLSWYISSPWVTLGYLPSLTKCWQMLDGHPPCFLFRQLSLNACQKTCAPSWLTPILMTSWQLAQRADKIWALWTAREMRSYANCVHMEPQNLPEASEVGHRATRQG